MHSPALLTVPPSRASTAAAIALLLVAVDFLADGAAGTIAPSAADALPPTTTRAAFYATPFERTPPAVELAMLGRALFFDPGLSASGSLSCASCHDPRRAYGPPASGVPAAGKDGAQRGFRSAPSLRYLQNVPPFTEHMHEAEGDDSIDQGPAGGRTWDGRAQSAHEQALLPLLSPSEMASGSADDLAGKLRRASYAQRMRDAFGAHVLDDTAFAVNAALLALEVFQQQPEEFYPYSSKYDAFLRGRVALTRAEARGLAAFNDPTRGNCASCHPSAIRSGAFPAFTDFGYVALGVPRNRALPENRDPRFFDLGLCGPARADLTDRARYCGMFRTPSLRNVALRRSFFHNGALRSLDQVVDFYAERDLVPERWYPRAADGLLRKFDDLPRQYAGNVNTEPPFDRQPGDRPALSRSERADIVAFLRTLTDGFQGGAAKSTAASITGDRGMPTEQRVR